MTSSFFRLGHCRVFQSLIRAAFVVWVLVMTSDFAGLLFSLVREGAGSQAVLAGLIIVAIPEYLMNTFRDSGIANLLAISGLSSMP